MNEARPVPTPAGPQQPSRPEGGHLLLVSPPEGSATPPPRARRPFEGWAAATGRFLRLLGRGVARASVLVFGHVRTQSERAYADFQKRDRHSRLRAYAFGSYALIAAITLFGQLYESNSLGAYVRVEKIDFPRPAVTVFIRNDSDRPWMNLKVILNGKYEYERLRLEPHKNFQVRVDKFAAIGGDLKTTAPQGTEARHVLIECDQGRFEKEVR